MVVGTTSLYAYEAAAGVFLEDHHIATEDVDILWDDRKKLTLPIRQDGRVRDFIGLLKKVDKTFTIHHKEPFRVSNSKGFMVDLLKVMPEECDDGSGSRMGGFSDVKATGIVNIDWLWSTPKFKQVVIGIDGMPAHIVVPDPRAFALHKFWTSQQPDRGRTKAARDRAQSIAVVGMMMDYLPHLGFNDDFMKRFPRDLVRGFENFIDTIVGDTVQDDDDLTLRL